MTPLFAEFIGTFILISVIAFVGNPIAIGAALWAAIVLVGRSSGGHFNPAVTLWAFLGSKISATRAATHIGAQLAAAAAVWLLSG